MTDEPQGESAQMTEWLERLSRDPLADAVRGRIRVVSTTDAVGRRRYQECRITATAEGPGIAPTPIVLEVVIDRRHWPQRGQVLPARISVSDPTAVDVFWDALRA